MFRQITVPHSKTLTLDLPDEFVEQQLEIIIFPVGLETDSETRALSDHSASTIEEWHDPEEDLVWR